MTDRERMAEILIEEEDMPTTIAFNLADKILSAREEKQPCEHRWLSASNWGYELCEKCMTYKIKNKQPLPKQQKEVCECEVQPCVIHKPLLKQQGIALLNPYRSNPPNNFSEVHYAMCKMADKIDEIINRLNLMEKEG